jgi:hypothetical protein
MAAITSVPPKISMNGSRDIIKADHNTQNRRGPGNCYIPKSIQTDPQPSNVKTKSKDAKAKNTLNLLLNVPVKFDGKGRPAYIAQRDLRRASPSMADLNAELYPPPQTFSNILKVVDC